MAALVEAPSVITLEFGPDDLPLGLPLKNAYDRIQTEGPRAGKARRPTKRAKSFRKAMVEVAARAGIGGLWVVHAKPHPMPFIKRGKWLASITHTPTMVRHLDHEFAHADVDSCVSPVLDALQLAGVIDDDARIDVAVLGKALPTEETPGPRLVVTLRRLQ